MAALCDEYQPERVQLQVTHGSRMALACACARCLFAAAPETPTLTCACCSSAPEHDSNAPAHQSLTVVLHLLPTLPLWGSITTHTSHA